MTPQEVAARVRPLTDEIGRGTADEEFERGLAELCGQFTRARRQILEGREPEAWEPTLASELLVDQDTRDQMGW